MLGSFFLSISISQGDARVCPPNNSPWLDPSASAVVKLDHSPQWALLPNAQSHTVERTQAFLGPATVKSHLAKSVSHDPSTRRTKQCWSSQVIPGFLQPKILDSYVLVPTLVKGWAAPLRDLNYFSLYPASLELFPNLHRLF